MKKHDINKKILLYKLFFDPDKVFVISIMIPLIILFTYIYANYILTNNDSIKAFLSNCNPDISIFLFIIVIIFLIISYGISRFTNDNYSYGTLLRFNANTIFKLALISLLICPFVNIVNDANINFYGEFIIIILLTRISAAMVYGGLLDFLKFFSPFFNFFQKITDFISSKFNFIDNIFVFLTILSVCYYNKYIFIENIYAIILFIYIIVTFIHSIFQFQKKNELIITDLTGIASVEELKKMNHFSDPLLPTDTILEQVCLKISSPKTIYEITEINLLNMNNLYNNYSNEVFIIFKGNKIILNCIAVIKEGNKENKYLFFSILVNLKTIDSATYINNYIFSNFKYINHKKYLKMINKYTYSIPPTIKSKLYSLSIQSHKYINIKEKSYNDTLQNRSRKFSLLNAPFSSGKTFSQIMYAKKNNRKIIPISIWTEGYKDDFLFLVYKKVVSTEKIDYIHYPFFKVYLGRLFKVEQYPLVVASIIALFSILGFYFNYNKNLENISNDWFIYLTIIVFSCSLIIARSFIPLFITLKNNGFKYYHDYLINEICIRIEKGNIYLAFEDVDRLNFPDINTVFTVMNSINNKLTFYEKNVGSVSLNIEKEQYSKDQYNELLDLIEKTCIETLQLKNDAYDYYVELIKYINEYIIEDKSQQIAIVSKKKLKLNFRKIDELKATLSFELSENYNTFINEIIK